MWIDPWGLVRIPNANAPHVVGREGTIVPPGGTISELIEHHVCSGYTFGETHDDLVDYLESHGVPDIVANVPTMIPSYIYSVGKDLSDLPSQQRPNNFPIIQIQW